jgi:hypothetical protein
MCPRQRSSVRLSWSLRPGAEPEPAATDGAVRHEAGGLGYWSCLWGAPVPRRGVILPARFSQLPGRLRSGRLRRPRQDKLPRRARQGFCLAPEWLCAPGRGATLRPAVRSRGPGPGIWLLPSETERTLGHVVARVLGRCKLADLNGGHQFVTSTATQSVRRRRCARGVSALPCRARRPLPRIEACPCAGSSR